MGAFGTRRLAYYCLVAYLCVACSHSLVKLLSLLIRTSRPSQTPAQYTRNEDGPLGGWGNDALMWRPSSATLYRQSTLRDHATSESLFLSKAFGHSMQPSRVIPFYFRAGGTRALGGFSKEDITILTIVTSNRFSVLGRLAQRYKGQLPSPNV